MKWYRVHHLKDWKCSTKLIDTNPTIIREHLGWSLDNNYVFFYSRLSKEMGDKLNDNNPGIADLSDPNRSTKVAEKYNSLYDNEWTDALESLTLSLKNNDEEAGVRYLLEIKKVGIIYLNVYIRISIS